MLIYKASKYYYFYIVRYRGLLIMIPIMSYLSFDSDIEYRILCAHLLAINVVLTLHVSLLVIRLYDPITLCVSYT